MHGKVLGNTPSFSRTGTSVCGTLQEAKFCSTLARARKNGQWGFQGTGRYPGAVPTNSPSGRTVRKWKNNTKIRGNDKKKTVKYCVWIWTIKETVGFWPKYGYDEKSGFKFICKQEDSCLRGVKLCCMMGAGGKSVFIEKGSGPGEREVREKDRKYWIIHPLPIILILHQ